MLALLIDVEAAVFNCWDSVIQNLGGGHNQTTIFRPTLKIQHCHNTCHLIIVVNLKISDAMYNPCSIARHQPQQAPETHTVNLGKPRPQAPAYSGLRQHIVTAAVNSVSDWSSSISNVTAKRKDLHLGYSGLHLKSCI